MKQFYIYLTTCLINKKQYIGSHYGYINDNYLGSGTALKAAIKKYGNSNFVKIVLESNIDKHNIFDRELYWINNYNACLSKNFYNISDTPSGGFCWRNSSKYSEKQRKKILKRWWRGIKRTRNQAALKGKETRDCWSDDFKANIRAKLSKCSREWWSNLTEKQRVDFIKNRTGRLKIKLLKTPTIREKQTAAQIKRWASYTIEERTIISNNISNAVKGRKHSQISKKSISKSLLQYNEHLTVEKRIEIDKKKSIAMSNTRWCNNGIKNARLTFNHPLLLNGTYKLGKMT
jgi:hypothetical protein